MKTFVVFEVQVPAVVVADGGDVFVVVVVVVVFVAVVADGGDGGEGGCRGAAGRGTWFHKIV